jgi:hypothetical protein
VSDPLSPAVRRAVVYLVTLTLLASAASLFWTAYAVRVNNHDRCSTVLQVANLHVPSGDITTGARRFDMELTGAFRQRAREIGCG